MALRNFFVDLLIPDTLVDNYVAELSKLKIENRTELERYASVQLLKETIGMRSHDIEIVMRKLHSGTGLDTNITQIVKSNILSLRITKDSLISIREIGRSDTGRVLKVLFCPKLTFFALKKIMIEDALVRKAVGNEVRFLYQIARSTLMDPELAAEIREDGEHNFMSDQVYSYVYPNGMNGADQHHEKAANNPYIVNFYDSYLDPEDSSVCLVLEFMNSGSIQNLINNGRKFTEDEAIVIAFSTLSALVDLHDRKILHRNIKPSNILTNTFGEVKIADFGISKGELMSESKQR